MKRLFTGLAAGLLLTGLAGCGKCEKSPPASPPGSAATTTVPPDSTMANVPGAQLLRTPPPTNAPATGAQKAIEDLSGKTTIDAGRRAANTIREISNQEKNNLGEALSQ